MIPCKERLIGVLGESARTGISQVDLIQPSRAAEMVRLGFKTILRPEVLNGHVALVSMSQSCVGALSDGNLPNRAIGDYILIEPRWFKVCYTARMPVNPTCRRGWRFSREGRGAE